MNSTLPQAVEQTIDSYVENLNERFPDLPYNFYLVGSIALGEFNEYFSDIDFVTILSRRMSRIELEKLQDIHRQVEKKYPHWRLSGSYFQGCDLGKLDYLDEPQPHYHDGILHREGLAEVSPITWWELKNYGIPVIGLDPQSLPFTVDWDLLIKRMLDNLNSYWVSWIRQPKRFLMLYSDWGIQWAVTGVLRQFYTFRENTITTKVKAARYALGCLPDHWHPIIEEAIYIRERKKSLYSSRIARGFDAVRFLRYIINTCNTVSYPV